MKQKDPVTGAGNPMSRSLASSDFANEIFSVLQSLNIDCESVQEELYDICWSKICDTYYNPAALVDWSGWRWKYKGRLSNDVALAAALKAMTASLNDRYTTFVTAEERKQARKADSSGRTSVSLLAGAGSNPIVHARLAQLGSAAEIDGFIGDLSHCCRQSSKRLGGIVLDLRDNPGGLLGFAVQVSALFLQEGLIVTSLSRQATVASRQEFRAEALPVALVSPGVGLPQLRGILQSLPLVILVNGGTASGAEVIASALQDNHRALVVGTTTFGKRVSYSWETVGTVGMLAISNALLISPSGLSVHGTGIKPDVEVQQQAGSQDVQLQEAIRVLDKTGR